MVPTIGTPSVASLYSVCIRSFDQLCGLLQTPNCEFSSQISLLALQDELGRFRVWAGNVGAHRKGRVSLDHRLREASQIHKNVTELLKDLDVAIQDVIAIVSHERQPSDMISWPSDSLDSSLEDGSTTEFEDERNLPTELQERFSEISHVITCLYKFSITIRNPAPRDKIQKCASIDVSHYEFFDIQHTSHKFPNAREYLINRLGKANTRRRQLLKYHEKHHNKLAQYIDLPQPGDVPVDLRLSQHEVASSGKALPTGTDVNHGLQGSCSNTLDDHGTIYTRNTQTTVSTYVEALSGTIEMCSDDGKSQTSYATSVSEDTGNKLRVPPPPKPDNSLEGEPFECPYCFSIKIVRGSRSWMKHVFRDLRPYVCTFRDCPKPDRLFSRRKDWYIHEVEVHRREWFCSACHQPFSTQAFFENHLRQNHLDLFIETQLPAVADRCERAIGSEQDCPLCQKGYFPRQLQSHLARHMQQLALFTLPTMPEETNGDEGNCDGESVGAQASKPDGEIAQESFMESTDLDLPSGSSQGTVDDISDTQNGIPDTQNETWRHLTTTEDPDYGEPQQEPDGGNVLKAAASGGHGELLPEVGVNANDNGGECGDMSQDASPKGDEKLATVYIAQGVLHDAARNGNQEIVRSLIENGADVNAQGGEYGNALQAAAEYGNQEIVQFLVENGADVNAKGGGYGNALQAAAAEGNQEIMQFLIENRADVNAQGGKYGNALQAAAVYGNQKIVSSLSKTGPMSMPKAANMGMPCKLQGPPLSTIPKQPNISSKTGRKTQHIH